MCLSGNQSFCLSFSFSLVESKLAQLPHPEQLPPFKLFILQRKVFESKQHVDRKDGFLKRTCINIECGKWGTVVTKIPFPTGVNQAKGDTYSDRLSSHHFGGLENAVLSPWSLEISANSSRVFFALILCGLTESLLSYSSNISLKLLF